MLDLTIFLCASVRKDNVKFLSPLFQSLIYENIEYVDNMNTNVDSTYSKAADIFENTLDDCGDLIVYTKGVRGMVVNLLNKYNIQPAKKVLGLTTKDPRARSRSRSRSPMRPKANSEPPKPDRPPSPTSRNPATAPLPPSVTGGGGGRLTHGGGSLVAKQSVSRSGGGRSEKLAASLSVDRSVIFNDYSSEEEEENRVSLLRTSMRTGEEPQVQVELQVEVIAATRLKVSPATSLFSRLHCFYLWLLLLLFVSFIVVLEFVYIVGSL
jgi:hypothetical protein